MWKETTGIFSGPVRRRLSPEDEFFYDGNVQRALLCKISVFALLEQGRRDEGDLVDIGAEEDKQPAHSCTFPNCSATFSSLKRVRSSLGLENSKGHVSPSLEPGRVRCHPLYCLQPNDLSASSSREYLLITLSTVLCIYSALLASLCHIPLLY